MFPDINERLNRACFRLRWQAGCVPVQKQLFMSFSLTFVVWISCYSCIHKIRWIVK